MEQWSQSDDPRFEGGFSWRLILLCHVLWGLTYCDSACYLPLLGWVLSYTQPDMYEHPHDLWKWSVNDIMALSSMLLNAPALQIKPICWNHYLLFLYCMLFFRMHLSTWNIMIDLIHMFISMYAFPTLVCLFSSINIELTFFLSL